MKELNLDEMGKVSGGCFFSCDGEWIGGGVKHGHKYDAYRCVDCGKEWYLKDGEKVQPSVYYSEFR